MSTDIFSTSYTLYNLLHVRFNFGFLFYTAIRILDVAVYKKHSAEDLMTIPTPGNASNLIRQRKEI
ncbi:MAG: hypothetical protein ACJ0BP_00115 [Gammaproteobacteria bacterium]